MAEVTGTAHSRGPGDGAAGPDGDVPQWFTAALATSPDTGTIDVQDCRISYLAWGDHHDPVLALVHGGAAHARWWSHVGPLLATGRRVVAVDLSGHGDSGWREQYDVATWTVEVLAAVEAAGSSRRPPVVVGHSLGGLVSMSTAALFGEDIQAAVILDAPILHPDPESHEARRRSVFRRPKVYPDLTSALGHFSLVPWQPMVNPWLLDRIAHDSPRRHPDGWTWKFDPRVFTNRTPARSEELAPTLASARCPVAIVRGECSSVVNDATIANMVELVAGSPAGVADVPVVQVPAAHHHLMLDQPLATVTALRTLLGVWEPMRGTAPA